MNAFQTTFTEASLPGCYFQICQLLVRKNNEVRINNVYEHNPRLALSPNDPHVSLPST